MYLLFFTGTLAITCLMVGDALSDYIDDNPSLCELVKYNETTGKNRTIELDLADCPAALDVVFTITFVTGLIMVWDNCVCMGVSYSSCMYVAVHNL